MQQRTCRATGGFTLIELMLVVVIVAILSLIALPMYATNATSARMSEAVTGAGSIRSAARIWLGTHGGTFGASGPTMTELGFDSSELGGKFVAPADYTFTPTPNSANFKVLYQPNATRMPGGKMYEINQSGVETTGGAYWTTGN